MDDLHILEGLNNEQLEAVTHESGPLLIIAGAGTGKTTVITRRIAQLIKEGKAKANEILALTFTEKAAGEMEERVESLLPMGYVDLWIATFHAFGERILKDHALDIGLSNDFSLLSETDQWLLLRSHIDEFDLNYYRPKGNPTKFVQALISHFSRLKDEDITPEKYLAFAEEQKLNTDTLHGTSKKEMSPEQQAEIEEVDRVLEVAKAYVQYQQLLREKNAMDFGDLIVETIHLFQERPAILEKFRKQFKYILVDEFQDTNFAQYDLIKFIAGPKNNLTVVADDDQSIYRFRGASMSNILVFKDDFPEAKSVSLVQNYRSTQDILDLAHSFIQSNNPNRLEESLQIDKRLKSHIKEKGIIRHLHSQSLEGEAQLVMNTIIDLKKANTELLWSDIAILVRANDSAQAFIPYLERAKIPYQFMASKGLFAKPVILDIVSFLRLLDNYHESRAMYRVLIWDMWGIPHEDIIQILHYGKKHTQSIYETCKEITQVTGLKKNSYTAVEALMLFIAKMSNLAREKTVGEVVLTALETSGYLQAITKKDTEKAAEEILYLNQFYKYIEAFEKSHMETTVGNFIQEIVALIDAGEQGRLTPDLDEGPDSVKIMTVHASKGLEFEHVFVVSMVDKRFPSIGRKEAIQIPDELVKDLAQGDADWHLEEERRLFYVAATRAKRGLYLTSAEDYGGVRKKKPSRFLIEAGFVDTKPEPTGEVLFQKTDTIEEKVRKVDKKNIPQTFSFTQIKAYETCPWQYRFAFLLKVPVPGKPSFSFGKTMHNTLYEFFRRIKDSRELQQGDLFNKKDEKIKGATLEDLLDIYETKWISEWFESKAQREEYYKKGRDILTAFYELHSAAWPNVTHLEEGFSLKIGDYSVKGAIDRVDALKNGPEIIDYKTGKFPKNGKKDVEQLYLYAMAMREIFKKDPIKLTYYFLEENKTIEIDFDAEKMQTVADWAIGIIDQILEGEFLPKPGFHCTFCDYKEICEYRTK